MIARCHRLASFSEDAKGTRRTYLSPPMRDVHREIAIWLEPLAMRACVDTAGNLRATYAAQDVATGETTPRLLIASHLDTVPNAGAFDGILGVVLAVALLESLEGKRFPFAIEVIGFSEEEGVRFKTPFIGSRALVGRLDEALLNLQDANGVSVRQAIENFGLHPAEIPQVLLSDDAVGYLEFHIEQGPVLEKLALPLAAVEVIAGQSRLEFTFVGRANHAGTTPMNLRFDAVAGAAEWIATIERTARSVAGLVATVGSIETKPGAVNIIASEARLSLDVRHRDDEIRIGSVRELARHAEEIAQRRGLSVRWATRMDQPAVAMDPDLTNLVEAAIRKAGCEPHRMVSGAGHDAMIMAEKVPAAMVFLRTPAGISHDPAESVAVDDVARAIECGMHFLDEFGASLLSTSRKRTGCA